MEEEEVERPIACKDLLIKLLCVFFSLDFPDTDNLFRREKLSFLGIPSDASAGEEQDFLRVRPPPRLLVFVLVSSKEMGSKSDEIE